MIDVPLLIIWGRILSLKKPRNIKCESYREPERLLIRCTLLGESITIMGDAHSSSHTLIVHDKMTEVIHDLQQNL